MYKHARWIKKAIEELNGIQKIAEIGVFKGYLVKQMLKYCSSNISEYWAIDPWVQYKYSQAQKDSGYCWPGRNRNLPGKWEKRYLYVSKLMRYFPKLHVVRATSVVAAKLFPEGYFGLVFIDGDHSYEGVIDDINAWLPLVKDGGVLCGHDYGNIGGRGVKKAVDELLGDQVEIFPWTTEEDDGLAIMWAHRK